MSSVPPHAIISEGAGIINAMSLTRVPCCLLLPLLAAGAPPTSIPARSGVEFVTSSPALAAAWAFAVPEAMGYVQTGRSAGFIPSYWAGLLDRPAFYARDVAHAALGAHVLGLDAENAAMLRVFCASATAGARALFPLWSFAFNGSVYPLDYVNDTVYVRETPTPFDLLTAAGQLAAWTGDADYFTDPALWRAWEAWAGGAFLALHDPRGDGVAGVAAPTGNIFLGAASYVENGERFVVAADALAKQAAALEAFAGFSAARGNATGAAAAAAAALALRARFQAAPWWDAAQGYARGQTAAGPLFGSKETQAIFPLRHALVQPGARADAHLAALLAAMPAAGTEARTYMPEALFLWGRPTDAAAFIAQLLVDPRNTYPEVSFTLVADLTVHLLGLDVDCGAAGGGGVTVTSLGGALALPAGVDDAGVRHMPACGGKLSLTQAASVAGGGAVSTLAVEGGGGLDHGVTWQARVRGSFAQLLVNGVAADAQPGVTATGLAFSSVTVQAGSGEVVSVAIPAAAAAGAAS